VIGKNPDKVDNIIKLVLWYIPLLVEVVSHFIANRMPGRVRYNPDAMYARAATAFTIILGGGMSIVASGIEAINLIHWM
jgi:hypothetical protein